MAALVDVSAEWGTQAYSFIEVFAGAGWISTCMKSAGHSVASFDILYGQPKEGKQDCMDFLSDSGFSTLVPIR